MLGSENVTRTQLMSVSDFDQLAPSLEFLLLAFIPRLDFVRSPCLLCLGNTEHVVL